MKNCIITPTFQGHFCYIKKYLKSFQINAEPKDNFEICFTISKFEGKAFSKIIQKFPELPIRVLFFEDILSYYHINETSDNLLEKYGKFSFQSLKKFYTMLRLGKDYRFLVLDSESLLYRPYNINKLFDDFFIDPFISGTDIKKRKLDFMAKAVKINTSLILKKETNFWFLENFIWFYDFKILSDLFTKYGDPLQIVDEIYQKTKDNNFSEIFEIDLYQTYVYQNIEQYHYRFINLDEEIKKFKNNLQYRNIHYKKYGGGTGLLEHYMTLIDSNNIDYFKNLFKRNKFNIIRCDATTNKTYLLQQEFLDFVNPIILAASQDHCWGINNTFTKKISIFFSKKEKLKKHLKGFFYPTRNFFKWFLEPFSILFYLLYFIKDFIINIKFLIK